MGAPPWPWKPGSEALIKASPTKIPLQRMARHLMIREPRGQFSHQGFKKCCKFQEIINVGGFVWMCHVFY